MAEGMARVVISVADGGLAIGVVERVSGGVVGDETGEVSRRVTLEVWRNV